MTIGLGYATLARAVLLASPAINFRVVLGRRLVTKDADLPLAMVYCRQASGESLGAASSYEFDGRFPLKIQIGFREDQPELADGRAEVISNNVFAALTNDHTFTREIEDISDFLSALSQPDEQGQPSLWVLDMTLTLAARVEYGPDDAVPFTNVSGRDGFGVDLTPEDDSPPVEIFNFTLEQEPNNE